MEGARSLWRWAQHTRPYRTYSHFTDVGGVVLSSGMSYQALFAVFAGLWVGFGVFGLILRDQPELLEALVTQINSFVPGLLSTGDDAGAVQLKVLLSARTLDWTSLVAALSLVWVAMNWFTGTRRSVRLIFGLEVKQYRSALILKLLDLGLAMCFFIAILVSAALTVFSSSLVKTVFSWLDMNPDGWLFGTLGTLVRYAAMFVFDVLVLMAINRVLAEVKLPWRSLLAGSMLGGLGLLVLKLLGGVLLGGATSNPLLATFAVLVGLLIWFNLLCRVLLLTSAWIATGQDRGLGIASEKLSALSLFE